jgi:GNAT superfamily N-acetyltransferase
MNVHVEPHTGPREQPLFELAENSVIQLDSYLTAGRVRVALLGTEAIGHLQLVATGRPGELEIKNMAVREDHQGRGVGARLVRAAVELAHLGDPAIGALLTGRGYQLTSFENVSGWALPGLAGAWHTTGCRGSPQRR